MSAKVPVAVSTYLKNLTTGNAISSLITSGKDVYIAAQSAGYYKNDVFVPLTNAQNIQFLALSDTTVFAAGIDHTDQMAYWQNNTETILSISSPVPGTQGDKNTGLSGMTVSGANAYVSGGMSYSAFTGAGTGNYGVLWNNGAVQYFGPGAGQLQSVNAAAIPGTAGVAVLGNDVYVAGIIPDDTYAGGYWENGTFNSINNGEFRPLAMLAFGNDVYIPGYTYTGTGSSYATQGAYWKNGTLINFPLAPGGIKSLVVNGTDVYLLGVDSHNNYVVWKNGAVFETLGPNSSTANYCCMAIGN